MTGVDPSETLRQRTQTPLLDNSGFLGDGIAGTEVISQEAIDCVLQPRASDSEPFAGPISDTRPWYRRPSPWFLFPAVFISASLFSSTTAPRNEIFISLACAYHRPEYFNTPGIPSKGTSPMHNVTLSILSTIATMAVPSPNRRCTMDPTVLAAVARLVTVQSLVLGVLTCLTAGWWGQMSDRHGRKLILGISVFGILLTEANIIFVSRYHGRVPGGYWFLVVTSAIDGMLGGLSTASAATHAYMADCVEPNARSRVFSLYLGTLFIGFALGPTIGSILIKSTQDLLTPFYVAVTAHVLMAPFYLLVLPESLSDEARTALTKKQRDIRGERADAVRQAKASDLWHTRQKFLALFSFLSPLAIFLPRKIEGTGRRDWNLTIVVASTGIVFAQISLIAYNTQYAIAAFGWRSEELGYWLTAVGLTKAFHMVVVLPFVTRLLKPSSPAVSLPVQPDEREPLMNRSNTPPEAATVTPIHPPSISPHAVARSDLLIARVSLLIDIASYIVVMISGGPVLFVVGCLALSFGGGFGPAASSLAMHLSRGQGSGKLFGAIAVANTIGSSLVGPAVFGLIYINTVGTFPKAIFVAAAASVIVAFGAMLLIRLPQEPPLQDVEDRATDEL